MEELPGKANYFVGNDRSRWVTGAPTYSKVKYGNIHPGIDMIFYGRGRELEYDFILAPGSDIDRIRLLFRDADQLRIDASGDLIVEVAGRTVVSRRPLVYQDVEGKRRNFAGSYVLLGKKRVGFRVPGYDRRFRLVLDPILSYSTYLGGAGSDLALDVAVDGSGNAYVAGKTPSIDFPAGARIGPTGGLDDAFVVKLNTSGSAVVYSTYLGGSRTDTAFGVAIDASGNAYVTGQTSSLDFPTVSPLQSTIRNTNGSDAFVLKLDSTGSSLLYSSYLGGSKDDQGFSIRVDYSTGGTIIIAGETNSVNFPVVNPFQGSYGGGRFELATEIGDAFIAKLNPAGSALIYSSYLGGSEGESGISLAVDVSGNAYVAGTTGSPNFPTLAPLQATRNGVGDAFLSKVAPSGSLSYSTYLGGSGLDVGLAVAVDSAGNAYLTGTTYSTDFPTRNALQTGLAGRTGAADAFVVKVNPSGSALHYSTYLGGSGSDTGSAIAVDALGNVYTAGYTESRDFPMIDAFQTSLANAESGRDAYIAKLNSVGSELVYSSYLGGSAGDWAASIAVDAAGNAYVVGQTASPDFRTALALQPTLRGAQDAFVAKISEGIRLYFAQFVDGVSGGDGLTSQIVLISRDSTNIASVLVEVNNDNGDPLAVSLNGEIVVGRKEIVVAPNGAVRLKTDGRGPLQIGSVTVTSDRKISGFVLIGGSLGEAGFGQSKPLRNLVVPVETSSGVNTGIAVMGLGQAQTINFELWDSQGTLRARAGLTLGSKAHLARFVTELPWDTPPNFANFFGTLKVVGTSEFAATAIRLGHGGLATLPGNE
ncbi:MAG: SBBP repeat-containing protein [Acidobacteriota bacterium]